MTSLREESKKQKKRTNKTQTDPQIRSASGWRPGALGRRVGTAKGWRSTKGQSQRGRGRRGEQSPSHCENQERCPEVTGGSLCKSCTRPPVCCTPATHNDNNNNNNKRECSRVKKTHPGTWAGPDSSLKPPGQTLIPEAPDGGATASSPGMLATPGLPWARSPPARPSRSHPAVQDSAQSSPLPSGVFCPSAVVFWGFPGSAWALRGAHSALAGRGLVSFI